jgi:hypothetical protein
MTDSPWNRWRTWHETAAIAKTGQVNANKISGWVCLRANSRKVKLRKGVFSRFIATGFVAQIRTI